MASLTGNLEIEMPHLFVLSRDPAENARLHTDGSVLAQCLHLAQLLSTVCTTEKEPRAHAPTPFADRNQPLAAWARETAANYTWVRRNLRAFLDEYQHRWGNASGKRHEMWAAYEALREPPRTIRVKSYDKPFAMTPFPQPTDYRKARHKQCDTVELHRMLYANHCGIGKVHKYTNRSIPGFMVN